MVSVDKVDKLFNPEDLMDVLETVKFPHTVGRLINIPMFNFSSVWRSKRSNQPIYHGLRLFGLVLKLMCTLIVGHARDLEDKSDHLSMSGYLTKCSIIVHALFRMF